MKPSLPTWNFDAYIAARAEDGRREAERLERLRAAREAEIARLTVEAWEMLAPDDGRRVEREDAA